MFVTEMTNITALGGSARVSEAQTASTAAGHLQNKAVSSRQQASTTGDRKQPRPHCFRTYISYTLYPSKGQI